MIGKRIRYYRLKKGLTADELALKLNCTKAAISFYESDSRTPDNLMCEKIADALDISVAKLYSNNNEKITFDHKSFRKKQSVSGKEIEILKTEIEDECAKRISIMNILGITPVKPFKAKQLNKDNGFSYNANQIRKQLSISLTGPFYSITSTLENMGIIVLCFPCDEKIDGLNGTANDIPYIFVNKNIRTIERIRTTIVHELCHLFFTDLEDNKENEKYITELAGNVLMPEEDVYKEFGKSNRNLTVYFRNEIAKKYKIAPSLLLTRLLECGVITQMYYKNYFVFLNKDCGKKMEKSFLIEENDSEMPIEFEHQVYRALSEELISASKAAEYLNIPLFDVMERMRVE